jgi:hypothetical protein
MKMAVLCVAQDGHFVVIEINLVDKCIDKSLLIFWVVYITFSELVQKESNLPGGWHWMLGGFK